MLDGKCPEPEGRVSIVGIRNLLKARDIAIYNRALALDRADHFERQDGPVDPGPGGAKDGAELDLVERKIESRLLGKIFAVNLAQRCEKITRNPGIEIIERDGLQLLVRFAQSFA